MYQKIKGSARTPEIIVSELSKYGKLEGIKTEANRFYKYFSFDGRYYESTHLNNNGSVGEAISIREISIEQYNYLLPTRGSSFDYKIGGF